MKKPCPELCEGCAHWRKLDTFLLKILACQHPSLDVQSKAGDFTVINMGTMAMQDYCPEGRWVKEEE